MSRLGPDDVARLLAGVPEASAAAARAWPGRPSGRQPVQVLYVPADRITPTTAVDAGREARRLLDAHLPDAEAVAEVFDLTDDRHSEAVRERVAAKLEREPVEDLRVDFEDGYLGRSADVEARDAVEAAQAVAGSYLDGTLPPFFGLRVKSFADGLAERSVATLDRFLGALLDAAGALPPGFVVTFPKIVAVEHVRTFADVLAALEDVHGLEAGTLRFEAQIETTASVIDASGRLVFRDLLAASDGRMAAAHVGVYDYTAGLGLPPSEQRLEHPALDWLRHLLQVSFAGTPVRLSDGSTNAVPARDALDELARVWRTHAAGVRHSLRHGYVQGWDLHPSHLVSRYVTVFAHLLDGIDDVIDRLSRWHGATDAGGAADAASAQDGGSGAADVTDVTDGAAVLDEPATVRRLEDHLLRALRAGALSEHALSGTPVAAWLREQGTTSADAPSSAGSS